MSSVLPERLRQFLSMLTVRPFDTSSAEGQSKERYRRIALTTAMSMLAKFVSIFTNLITIPMTLHYLGKERYGMWITINSVFILLNSADLGLGNGLLTAIAAANGKDDRALIRKQLSSGFFLLLGIAVFIGLLFFALNPVMSFQALFNVKSEVAVREVNSAMIVLVIIFAVNLPLTTVLRFHEGLQEGFFLHLASLVGSLISFVLILASVFLHLGVPWLVFGLLAGTCLSNAVVFVRQFGFRRVWARPSIKRFDAAVATSLLRHGGLFFLLTVLTLLGFQTDSLVIAHINDQDAVTQYSVVQRMSQVAFLYWAFVQALWPAYGEAMARGDYQWLRRTIVRSLKLSFICGLVMGAILVLFGQAIINVWIKDAIEVPPGLLLSFGAFIFVNGFIGTLAVIFNAAALLKTQCVLLLLASVTAFLLKIEFCRSMGVQGVVWATVVSYLFLFVLPGWRIIYRKFWSD
ncbi:MAG: polysaccharide biosynthesis protein [Verrucomicrobiales bacterium]|nr:polysaccharide biosynthesis protein [Verrucomicrobiales bacterium]